MFNRIFILTKLQIIHIIAIGLLISCIFCVQKALSNESQIIKLSQIDEEYDDFDDFEDFNFDVKAKTEIYDPFEKVNRKIFVFNDVLDRKFLEPIAIYYRNNVPKGVIKSIRNFIQNVNSPFSVINSLLQGDSKNAMSSFSSFLINTTLGVGGLFDVAGKKQITYNKEDLGQTLGVYGVGSGPYLMLPFFGPSNLRDGTAMFAQNAINPLSLNLAKIGDDEILEGRFLISFSAISVIDKRESLLKIISDLRRNSFDIYATSRSAYMQNRRAKINNTN